MKLLPHSTNYALVECAMLMRKADVALRVAQPLLNSRDASTQWFIGYLYENGHLRGTGNTEWEWYRDAAEHTVRSVNQRQLRCHRCGRTV